MANQTLRQLAKQYSLGNLEKDDYRKSRAELLQGIVAGNVSLAEIDYPPPVQPPEPESLDTTERREDLKRKPAAEGGGAASADDAAAAKSEAAPAPTAPATAAAAEKSSNKGIIIGLVVAVVLIGVAVVGMMGGKDEKADASSTGDMAQAMSSGAEPAASESVSSAAGKAEELIKEFLANNNWSEDSLGQFSQDWSALSNEEITATDESVALGQLTNAIYRQLLEEQALSGLVDDDSSLSKQRRLVEFASSLGISDSRIKLPEE